MVQVIQRATQGPSRGQKIAEALQGALDTASKMYQEHQKKQGLQQALQNLEGTYADPNLSEQQKLIKSYQQLAGTDPQMANQLGGYLSRLGGQQEGFRQKLMGQQEEKNRLNQSFQNIQSLYGNPELSDEEKVFGLYQELSNNPTLANNLLGSLQKPGKAREQDIAGEQYSKGYNAIVEGDNEALKGILEDKNTPLNVKKQLTDLKNQQETRKSVQDREMRARQSLVQKSYKQAIDAEQAKLKDLYLKPPQIASINKKIKRLEALQRHDLKRLAKNPKSYEKLSLWNNVDPDYFPEEEEEVSKMESEFMEPEAEQEKVKFNPKDPAHIARAKRAMQEAGGDRARANQILAEEFSL